MTGTVQSRRAHGKKKMHTIREDHSRSELFQRRSNMLGNAGPARGNMLTRCAYSAFRTMTKTSLQSQLSEDSDLLPPSPRGAEAGLVEPGTGYSGSGSMVSRVVDGIIDRVRNGRLAPGQRLIAADLAEEFEVSRAPVREALHVLSGEGVVTLTRNRGARIRKLSTKELVDFMEFTEALLVLGVRKTAARKLSPREVNQLDAAWRLINTARETGSAVDFVESLYRYHIAVNRLSGNAFISFFYERRYFTFFNRLVSDLLDRETWPDFAVHYADIHRAIINSNPHAASAAFVAHIQWVLDLMYQAGEEAEG